MGTAASTVATAAATAATASASASTATATRTTKQQIGNNLYSKEQQSEIARFDVDKMPVKPCMGEVSPVSKASETRGSPSLKSTQSWTWRGLQPARRSWGRRGSNSI